MSMSTRVLLAAAYGTIIVYLLVPFMPDEPAVDQPWWQFVGLVMFLGLLIASLVEGPRWFLVSAAYVNGLIAVLLIIGTIVQIVAAPELLPLNRNSYPAIAYFAALVPGVAFFELRRVTKQQGAAG